MKTQVEIIIDAVNKLHIGVPFTSKDVNLYIPDISVSKIQDILNIACNYKSISPHDFKDRRKRFIRKSTVSAKLVLKAYRKRHNAYAERSRIKKNKLANIADKSTEKPVVVTHKTCEEVEKLCDAGFSMQKISQFLEINLETVIAIDEAGFNLEKYIHSTEKKQEPTDFALLPIPEMNGKPASVINASYETNHLIKWLVKKVSVLEKSVFKLEKEWTNE